MAVPINPQTARAQAERLRRAAERHEREAATYRERAAEYEAQHDSWMKLLRATTSEAGTSSEVES